MEEMLEKFGLNKNEAKVYLALLELGTTTTKRIIEKISLHRQIVYDALDFLISKGLVSYILEAKIKQFRATPPRHFLELIHKKQQELEEQKTKLKEILPELELRMNKKEEQEATLFRGNKGIKVLLDDMLNENKEILTIGASDFEAESLKYHLEFNLPRFHNTREAKKIVYKIILSEERKERSRKLNKMKYCHVKVLPKEFTSNSSTNIYGDKVSIIMWGSQPFGILIKSKEIAQAQRKHFEILWKIAKKV